MTHHDNNSSDKHEIHIVPLSVFRNILLLLLALTIVTVGVSRIDFGVLNIVVAMGIASVKALLVALFFMHLKYESPVTWLYAGFPILILITLLAGVFLDNPTRVMP